MAKSLLKTRKKKTVRRGAKSLDQQYLGVEPTWSDETPTSVELGQAYTWYNYFNNQKDAVKLLFSNYPGPKADVALLRRLPDWKIPPTICYQARMVANGCKLPEENQTWFNEKVAGLLADAKKLQKIAKKEAKTKAPVISVQERIKDQISGYIAEIEAEIDAFVTGDYRSEFDMYAWLQKNGVKSQQANAVSTYYVRLLAELKEAKAKSCDQLNEAYADVKPRQLGRFIEFVQSIVDGSKGHAKNQKTVRKARAKKPTSTSKQVKNMKYQAECPEHKIVSINPADIIGASQLWYFNTKYKELTRLDARTRDGFSIKGTTIEGIDLETSDRRKIRKPEETLPRVLDGGKRILGKLMGEITTKKVDNITGRVNKNVVLLRVIR